MINNSYRIKKYLKLIIATIWLITGCDSSPSGKTYLVATDATLVPMSFMSVGNDIIGFEPDFMRAIAKEAGINIRMINVEWAGLFGGLITEKFDMVISSVTVLEERKERMAFSEPYLKSGLALVVRKNEEDINSFEDVQKNKKLVGGEIDAVLGESTGTLFYKNQNKPLFNKIKMVGEIMTDEHYAIVFRKGDNDLLTQINSALQKVLADGTAARLHRKWDLGQAAQIPK
jgi:ABC-type amino acid transport substrate-binding protein